jgi:hypothetical protein
VIDAEYFGFKEALAPLKAFLVETATPDQIQEAIVVMAQIRREYIDCANDIASIVADWELIRQERLQGD